ncbi:YbjN domain-containing protein [Georgenia muralis]|uniref:Putative sensory transduction regulator n=1 Tax=Georgenia muralis TaxID=154117 RepID=A0A3N5A882_9MICO|nr:YbjN domain-containing protein [Georgenia muralis]RPF27891.1 putative sensory transduction regulator [Georgenia muralis]
MRLRRWLRAVRGQARAVPVRGSDLATTVRVLRSAGSVRRTSPAALTGPLRATTPVTPERVHDVVVDRGYHVRTEPDGSVDGLWDGYRFQLRLAGEEADFLSVRGTWGRAVPEEYAGALAQAVNDWNRDKIWPTVYTADSPEGPVVRTEVLVDVGAGATDRQLLEIIEGGLSAGVQFFQALTRSVPPVGGDEP